MADIGVCNPSGCYGRCPTSTRCSRRCACPPVSPCPPGGYVQRASCGCGCRCPAPEKCPLGVRVKDYLNVLAEDLHYFKHYYKLFRSTPKMPNKPSQMPKGPDGKPLKSMKGKGKGGKGDDDGSGGRSGGGGGSGNDKTGGLFDNYDDDNYGETDRGDDYYEDGDGEGGDGTGGGGGRRRRKKPKPSKEARLKNKLNTLFDEALKTGMLNERGRKGKKGKKDKKRSPEYYKENLGISVSCVQDCEPLCCYE